MNLKMPITVKQEILSDKCSFVKAGPIEFYTSFLSPSGAWVDLAYEIMFRFAIKYQSGQSTNEEREYIQSILSDKDYIELIEKLKPMPLSKEREKEMKNYIPVKLPARPEVPCTCSHRHEVCKS